MALLVAAWSLVPLGMTADGGGSPLMPPGLEAVRLGMTREQLATVRTVRPFRLPGAETSDIAAIWVERDLTHPHYNSVLYCFSEDGRLEVVSALLDCPGATATSRARGFVRACLDRWGGGYRLLAANLRHGGRTYLAPLLVWTGEDANVAATFTPAQARADDAKAMFQMSVFAKTMPLEQLFRLQAERGEGFKQELQELARPAGPQ